MPKIHANSWSKWIGVIFIAVGVIYLLNNAGILYIAVIWHFLWPLVLIAIGLLIIFAGDRIRLRTPAFRFGDRKEIISDDIVEFSHSFGDVKVELHSKNLIGGKLQITFGELHVDLRQVKVGKDAGLLSLAATFGEIHLHVPDNFPVRISASVVAGDIRLFNQKTEGVNQKTSWQSDAYELAENKLDLELSLVFGDINVS